MTSESKLRAHRCCFTGHRPEKLTMPEHTIKAALESKIRAAIGDGYQTFISGMARGVDIWAAEIVLRLRREGIRSICALPYSGFEARWSAEWQARYRADCSRRRLGAGRLPAVFQALLSNEKSMDGGPLRQNHCRL